MPNERADGWVERVAGSRVDQDLRVLDAEQQHQEARAALLYRPKRAQAARLAAYARTFGSDAVSRNRQAYLSANPAQQATRASEAAKQAREDVELLRSLTPAEAAARSEQTRAAQAAHIAEKHERERASQEFEQRHRSATRQGGISRGLYA